MCLFVILCSYAKMLTSSKEIVQVGLQARCFPTSVILVPLVFICSSNRVFIHRQFYQYTSYHNYIRFYIQVDMYLYKLLY